MRRQIWFLAAFMAAGLAIAGASIGASAATAPTLNCEMVALKHISPQQAMMALGLCTDEKFFAGGDMSWNLSDTQTTNEKQAQKETSVSPMMPKGIRAVTSVRSKQSLLVIGDNPSLEQFKTIIAMLDVQQKQVQVKTEVYEVKAGSTRVFGADESSDEKKIDAKALKTAFISAAALKGLKTQLEEDGAQLRSTPIISTVNNMPACIGISNIIPLDVTATANDGVAKKSIEIKDEIRVLPRINSDATVTVSFRAVVPRPDKSDVENAMQSESPLTAVFTAKSGESVALYQNAKESEDWLLFIVTPTVIEDAPGEKTGVGLIN